MSGDLRAAPPRYTIVDADEVLAALDAADEPLVSEVECPRCRGAGGAKHSDTGLWFVCNRCPNGTGTVRGVWLTEDVLRERLREALGGVTLNRPMVDALVRALFGEAGDG